MLKTTRYTLPREVEMARIAPSPDDSPGERLEFRYEGDAFVALVITRRGGEQHRGQGASIAGACDQLATVLPSAAQRTSRAGSTIAFSKLLRIEAALQAGARLTLQRSVSLQGAWKAALAAPTSSGVFEAFADSVCDALLDLPLP